MKLEVRSKANLTKPGRHRAGRLCKTNPISRHGRAGRGLGDKGQMCKTNPISGSWSPRGIPSIPLFHYSSIPVPCRLCKTNPISRRGRAAIPRPPTPSGLGPRRVDCAKQSQFPPRAGAMDLEQAIASEVLSFPRRACPRHGSGAGSGNPPPYAGRALPEATRKRGFDLSGTRGYPGEVRVPGCSSAG